MPPLAGKRCAIVGAGVIGNACAFHLAKHTKAEVFVLEKAASFGTETSARNSEVIHAGLYYPKNSLKSKLCVEGSRRLYSFLTEYNVPHRKCGKILVACNEHDEAKLKQLRAKAVDNGVTSLVSLTKGDVRRLEPEVECYSALLSPETGILDSHQFQSTLEYHASTAGASYIYNCEVKGIHVYNGRSSVGATLSSHQNSATTNRFEIETSQGPFDCDIIINAAGLHSISMAQKVCFQKDLSFLCDSYLKQTPSSSYFAKGNYFKLTSSAKPFNRLVYPVPADNAGLGVHATIDMSGSVRFGPDVEWLRNSQGGCAFSPNDTIPIDYTVNENRKTEFIAAIQRYFPNITKYDIETDYSGIRPKLCAPNMPPDLKTLDFQIVTQSDHGVPGLVNLFGMESPGLTSSLAIASYVCDQILCREA